MGYIKTSPFIMNWATYVLVDIFNWDYLYTMTFDLQNFTRGYFEIQDPILNYYDEYIAVGFTADFSNSTFFHKKNVQTLLMSESGTWAIPSPIDDETLLHFEEVNRLLGLAMLDPAPDLLVVLPSLI